MKSYKSMFLVLLLGSTLFAKDDVEAAKMAAKNGYQNFLGLCLSVKDARSRHRLDSSDGVANATIGEPIAVPQLLAETINNYDGSNIQECLTWNSTFYVPVLFDGEAKLMLTVRKFSEDGEYKIAALGDGLLVKELALIERKQRFASSLILIFNRDTRLYSFHIPEVDSTNLTLVDFSIDSNRSVEEYSSLSTVHSAMEELQAALSVVQKRGSQW
jgi:hypothetical protein